MRIAKILALVCCAAALSNAAGINMTAGKVELKSAGALAMGPEGILLVGDSAGGKIVALDVDDAASKSSASSVEIKGINEKIAAMLGTTADQILIQDIVVSPQSKSVYLAVSRGRGADAAAVILRATAAGKLSEISLANIKHQAVSLSDQPQQDRQRVETITQLKYLAGKVYVAGLSNEEFSSSLRAIPFPFNAADKGAGIEIWHGSHGRFETNAPVRTFVPYEINGEKAILAAYTCTPLVRIPVSELKPGNKVKGTTIAELGAGNKPLDMIVYSKEGKNYILMANSRRGVMKLTGDHLETYKPITTHTEITGVPYETIANLKGVQQLDKFDDSKVLVLMGEGASLDLVTVPLP
ncbi:MAG TPA: hypothetical protein VKE70_14240 [Candidatus Solibacter sp.]|nr:hypothetical protein [Candidatus Solibacter sp.]